MREALACQPSTSTIGEVTETSANTERGKTYESIVRNIEPLKLRHDAHLRW
jgi:hypothetical protein